MVKVLLDTDIGSDIDDAICLAYLLVNPNCDLLGITTVTGQPELRASLASALCKVAKKDIPIFPGLEKPILIEQRQPDVPQALALGKWDHQSSFPAGQAINFLRDTIRSYTGEIVLLTIGPLTNIGLLFTVDPEIPSLLKGLVMMCGTFGLNKAVSVQREWNAMLDPHATAIVYQSKVKMHRSIGLDVTTKVAMEAANVWQLFTDPLLLPVLDFAEVWFRDKENITFHDPLAATTIFNQEICHFERGKVELEFVREDLQGQTKWLPGGDSGDHEIATEVNPTCFFDEYFKYFQK